MASYRPPSKEVPNVRVVRLEKKIMTVEVDTGAGRTQECYIQIEDFKAIHRQLTKDVKDCPPFPKRCLRNSRVLQSLDECLQKLFQIDPVPPSLLKMVRVTESEQDQNPTLDIEPTVQVPFPSPVVHIINVEESGIMNIFKAAPRNFNRLNNDIVLRGILTALGYTPSETDYNRCVSSHQATCCE